MLDNIFESFINNLFVKIYLRKYFADQIKILWNKSLVEAEIFLKLLFLYNLIFIF
jgi:hypothetical protein